MKKVIVNADKSLDIKEYAQLLEHVKIDILQTQLKAVISITSELTMLYWRIGKNLSHKIQKDGWGTKAEEKLAQDLKILFPGLSGFSSRNLRYMRKFAESYDSDNLAIAVAKLPWGHNISLLECLQSIDQRLWYAQKTIENGWSRSMLEMWIKSDLFHRQGKAITNFKATLPSLDTDLAEQMLKDPYNFNFLTIDNQSREKEVEDGLIKHMEKFLIELGQGFLFAGRQYKIIIGDEDFFIDMLFYNYTLRCFFVIELKATKFNASNVGQLNQYLSAIDMQLKHPDDNPTIGLILCRSKNKVQAEYALRGINNPIGIADYTTIFTESLPKEFKGTLPTIEEIEAELEKQEIMQELEIKSKTPKTIKTVKKSTSKKK